MRVFGFAAITGFVTVLVLVVLALGPGDAGSLPGAQAQTVHRGASGELVDCPGGEQVQKSFTQRGGSFVLVGTLEDIRPDAIVVDGALGEAILSTTDEPRVEGEYGVSDLLRAAGRVTEGGLSVLDVQQVCEPVFVTEIVPLPDDAPVVTPGPAGVIVGQERAPLVTVAPAESFATQAPPVVEQAAADDDGRGDDRDDKDDGDDEKEERGRRSGDRPERDKDTDEDDENEDEDNGDHRDDDEDDRDGDDDD